MQLHVVTGVLSWDVKFSESEALSDPQHLSQRTPVLLVSSPFLPGVIDVQYCIRVRPTE